MGNLPDPGIVLTKLRLVPRMPLNGVQFPRPMGELAFLAIRAVSGFVERLAQLRFVAHVGAVGRLLVDGDGRHTRLMTMMPVAEVDIVGTLDNGQCGELRESTRGWPPSRWTDGIRLARTGGRRPERCRD